MRLRQFLFPLLGILLAVVIALGALARWHRDSLSQSDLLTGSIPRVGDTLAAELPWLGEDGSKTDFAQLAKGSELVVINFWASWCGPCVLEMPSLLKLAATFGERGVKLVLVNVDDSPASVLAETKAKLKITQPVLIDPDGKLSDALGVRGLPLTFVVRTRDRQIMHVELGERNWMARSSQGDFERWLAAGSQANR